MTRATVRESVKVAGLVDRVRVVRSFVAGVLGEGHPLAEVVVLLAGEVVSNSMRHGGSAVAGGVVTVTVIVAGGQCPG